MALVSLCLMAGAVARNTIWYSDIEVIANPNTNIPVAAASWSATLFSWCWASAAFGGVNINPACWDLTSSPVNYNPANDANLDPILNQSELKDAANALQRGSYLTTVAIGLSLLVVILFAFFAIAAAIVGRNKAAAGGPPGSLTCLLFTGKFLGFCWWLASSCAMWIYLGAVFTAGQDSTFTTVGGLSYPLIGTYGLSTGFHIMVGAHALSLVGCCFFLFVCQGDFAEELLLDTGADGAAGAPVGPVLGVQRGQIFSVPSPAGGAPLININLAPAPRYVKTGGAAGANPQAPSATPSAAAYSVAFAGSSSQGAGAAGAAPAGSGVAV